MVGSVRRSHPETMAVLGLLHMTDQGGAVRSRTGQPVCFRQNRDDMVVRKDIVPENNMLSFRAIVILLVRVTGERDYVDLRIWLFVRATAR
jgi:hypothetical protein